MMLVRYMCREMRRRPERTVLTLIGIVIGVQALVAIPISIETTRDAHRALFEGLTGRAALQVVPSGQGGLSPALAADLENVNDVAAIVCVVQGPAAVVKGGSMVPVVTLGFDLGPPDAARDYSLLEGSYLTGDDQVLLEAGFARSLAVQQGATIQLLTPSGMATLHVAGLLEPRGVAAANGGAVAILPLSTAQRLHGLGEQVNSLNIVLKDDADAEQVRVEVTARLPAGLTVQAPASRAALAQETMANTERMLAVLSIVSLVAGAFVIVNSFLMSLGERRRSLAILRSLGATRRQVTRLLIGEALTLGVVGTAVGIPLGLGAAYLMTVLMAQLSGVVVPGMQLSAGPVLLAAILGPGVALLATFVPARDAGRRSPLPELRGQPQGGASRAQHVRHWPGTVGLVALALFVVAYTLILTRALPRAASMILPPIGMVLMMVGSALTVPLVMLPLTRLSQRLLQPFLGIEAKLAVRQLQRHPTRTSLVAGVLMVSVMISAGFGNSILNSVRDAREWMVRIYRQIDFLVVPTALSATELLPAAMPEEYAERIAGIEGVTRVGKGTVLNTRAAGQRVVLFARTCAEGEDPGFRLVGDNEDEVRRGLRRGEVVVGSALAQRTGLRAGDDITLDTRQGKQPFRIVGLTSDYTAGGLVVLMAWNHANRYFDVRGARYIYAVAAPGQQEAVDQRLREFCRANSLILHSRTEFTAVCDRMIGGVIGAAWVLMALVFVVASLGITNCLTMNVLEQTRELGILRATAMKRRQVFKMIVAQALCIGVVGAVPGALLGVVMGYAAGAATYSIVGMEIPYELEQSLLIGCVVISIMVAVLASLFPARRAGRLTIIRALQYE